MLPIAVDISPIIMEYKLVGEKADALASAILDSIVDKFMYEWEEQIKTLGSTREEYRKGIRIDRVDDRNAVISLSPTESRLALMLEEGATSFDMKEGFSKSNKRVINEETGEWYLTIPFRWATTEAIGESAVFSNKMPAPIQGAVKSLPINVSTGNTAGLKFDEIPQQYQQILQNFTTGQPHTAPIYQGLRRQDARSTKKEVRSNYFSFRRVSSKSPAGSWWHRGFSARRFMDKAIDKVDIESIVSKSIDDFLGL
jgi:hypothetical protein